jgi:hypothetical protein
MQFFGAELIALTREAANGFNMSYHSIHTNNMHQPQQIMTDVTEFAPSVHMKKFRNMNSKWNNSMEMMLQCSQQFFFLAMEVTNS